MHTFKNLSTHTPMGINTVDRGTIYVPPGQTSPALNVAESELSFHKKAGLFDVKSAKGDDDGETLAPKTLEDGSVEQSTAHREGNPVKPGPQAAATGAAEGGAVDFDAMTDEQLRAFITDRDGAAPHPRTGRDKLVAKAKGEEEAV